MSPSPGDELPGLDEPIFQSLVAILYDPRDRGCRARIAVRRVGPEHIAVYGAYAVPLVALVLGWIAWIWRSGASPAGQVAAGHDLDRIADLLAVAAKQQWDRAAGERGWRKAARRYC